MVCFVLCVEDSEFCILERFRVVLRYVSLFGFSFFFYHIGFISLSLFFSCYSENKFSFDKFLGFLLGSKFGYSKVFMSFVATAKAFQKRESFRGHRSNQIQVLRCQFHYAKNLQVLWQLVYVMSLCIHI